ncbi:hypothetical protein HAX54_027655 [Datura stramonium]|uniref:Uncharacterized protein n=1 Tax=Datura stramonium TaxID=4076 RepID=A0ABS8S8W3_DATST|nr:hypothetical protein [Datura stramonium]
MNNCDHMKGGEVYIYLSIFATVLYDVRSCVIDEVLKKSADDAYQYMWYTDTTLATPFLGVGCGRFQLVSGDLAMLTCELMRKCEMLVIMKYNKGGIGRSMLTGGVNSPVCVLVNEFCCSKVCLAAADTLQREVDCHSGSAAAKK